MSNSPLNSPEIEMKMPANPDEFTRKMTSGCDEQRKRRGSYCGRQKADLATMAIASARAHLVEIIQREALTTDSILRHVSMTLVQLGEADGCIKESTLAWLDFIGNTPPGE